MSSKTASPEEVVQHFKQLKAQVDDLANQIVSIESDQNEYRLVLESLNDVPADRGCFRLIQGTLVERTVGQVKPVVEDNLVKIGDLLEKMKKQYTDKEKELDDYRTEHKIVVRRA